MSAGRRRATARTALLTISAALLVLGTAGVAAAAPPQPAELRVEGGEEAWRPARSFRVVWTNPTLGGSPPIVAARYRLRDPSGTVVTGTTRLDWPSTSIERLDVPGPPGAYTAEVWLEDSTGAQGPPAGVKLRFDDTRPGGVQPLPGPSWIGRAAFPLAVRLGHPTGALPLSGIRGYAVSVSAATGESPCGAPDRCTDAETDLHGGVGGDSYPIADLPEGVSHMQVVAVSGSGMASAQPGLAVLRVDKRTPVTTLSGAPGGWVNHAIRLTASASDDGSGMAPAGDGAPPFTAIAIDGGPPAISSGDSVTTVVVGEGLHRIAHYARDLAGNVGSSSGGLPGPSSAVVRIDREPPSISFANSQDPLDPELIRARIGDSLSGPDPTASWIGVRRTGSGDRFEPLPATISAGGMLSARWDSESQDPGEYEFRAVVHDAAGNRTATIRRADGTAMVLSNPLKETTTLRAGFGGKVLVWHRCAREEGRRSCRREEIRDLSARPPSRVVPYGRGLLVSGLLTAGPSAPLSRMPVRIVERFTDAAGPGVRVSTVTTDPDGAFAIHLAPGPSREISAFFDGSATLGRSSSAPVRLGVSSGVRLRASSSAARIGGAPLVFRGQVFAVPGTMPAGGKSVQLQFRLPGLPWSEFRTVQTDRRGRFRYAYRFTDDDSRGARFQFRAYAPAQDGWPYEPGGSRPAIVRGI